MLKREFYLQNCITLAKNLLGKLLVYHSPKGKISGIITETESYLGVEDKASKAYKRRHRRADGARPARRRRRLPPGPGQPDPVDHIEDRKSVV